MQDRNHTFRLGRFRRAGSALVAVFCACAAFACTAEVETTRPVVATDDEAIVEAETVPVNDVHAYPQAQYHGHVVYYVNGRWFVPRGRRWYYYRTEPPELVRHRRYIEQAPPAPRGYAPGPDEAVRVR